MVTKAPEKLINLLWFLSLSWLAIVYRLLKNIKWPMTTQDVSVAKCLGTSNQTDKIVLDPLQNTYGDVLPGSLKWTSYSVLTGFQGSVQVQFRFSQFSDTQLKSSTSSGASENVNYRIGRSYSPRAHVEGVHAQYFLRPEKCQQCRGLCKTRNTAFNVHFKTSTYLFHNIAKINAIRVDCRT